jgi:hypothetical protein
MRNKETQTYKGAEILTSLSDSVVFLTATPIMISTENLFNLLHLLDGTRYFNYQIFNARLQENAPFVRAITALNHNSSLRDIFKKLTSEEIVKILNFLRDSNNIVRFFRIAKNSAPSMNGPHHVFELLKISANGMTKTITTGNYCNFAHPFKEISETHRYS